MTVIDAELDYINLKIKNKKTAKDTRGEMPRAMGGNALRPSAN
jgi:hypothetical protein